MTDATNKSHSEEMGYWLLGGVGLLGGIGSGVAAGVTNTTAIVAGLLGITLVVGSPVAIIATVAVIGVAALLGAAASAALGFGAYKLSSCLYSCFFSSEKQASNSQSKQQQPIQAATAPS